jgi:predicted MFS family arabinose efflux permease
MFLCHWAAILWICLICFGYEECIGMGDVFVGCSNPISWSFQPNIPTLCRSIYTRFYSGKLCANGFRLYLWLIHWKTKTLLLVFINTGYLVAGIFGQLCSAYLSEVIGWRSVFYFFSLTYFLFFIILLKLVPVIAEKKGGHPSSFSVMKLLLKDKNLLKSYFVTFSLLLSSVAFYETIERTFEGTAQTLRTVGLLGAILSIFTGTLIERWKTSGTFILVLWHD